MDDRTMCCPPGRAVLRRCEAGRFQKELLARAYEQVSPQVRRALVGNTAPAHSPMHQSQVLTARRLAQGA